jgi:TPR repeat protein
MLVIGNYYLKGIGVDKNYSSALYWYRLALEKGEYDAYIKLSMMYENGYGVDVDYEKATKYLRIACIHYKSYNEGNNYIISFMKLENLAEDGIVSAQYNLAEIYLQGIGVQRNFENALSLYQKAADKNYVKAIYELSNIHEDEKYALLCLQKAVNMCYAKAQYNLAYKYLWGNDLVEKDEEKGIQLLKLSAYQGYAKAQYSLAIEYIEQDKEGKDKDIINLVSDYKLSQVDVLFKSSSESIRAGVKSRFQSEKQALLSLIK